MKLIEPVNGAYPIMEHFYTIQGEGAQSGRAAYFIRLGGCDVGCPWCDVKESWPTDGHNIMSIEAMVVLVKNANARNVVITGGEPCMYNLVPLTTALKEIGAQLWLETSGAYPIPKDAFDWVVMSPKKFKAPLEENLPLVHELKVVIVRKPDFSWAEQFKEQVNKECTLFLQPEWSKESAILPEVIAYVKRHDDWRISLQTHKYMDIP